MGVVASSSDLETVKMARVGPHLQQLAQNAELSQSVGQGKTGLQVCLKNYNVLLGYEGILLSLLGFFFFFFHLPGTLCLDYTWNQLLVSI